MFQLICDQSPAEVTDRLRKLLQERAGSITGSVTDGRIRIAMTQQLGNSALRPVLLGAVTPAGPGGSKLSADFRLVPIARFFLIGWLTFAALWTLVTASLIPVLHQPFGWVLPLMGLFGIVFCIGLVKFAKRFYWDDRLAITQMLVEELRGRVIATSHSGA